MTTDLLKPELSFLNNMDLPHKNAWAPFSNYTLQLHMDFHGFKWLISFCACSFQISIIMFIFLYRLTGGDDHADQRGKACLKCFCDTFDSDRCMNSLTRRWMSICSRSMIKLTLSGCPRKFYHRVIFIAPSSGHISLNLNVPFKLILRRSEVVFWCLE